MSNIAPIISIVVPIYNGEKFIPELISSLQSQTFEDFEIILIDDFSTDNSRAMLEEYAKNDPRIRVIPRDIKGGCAVKGIIFALPYCRGEFYFFLSQDDFISKDCLSNAYNRIIETSADAVLPDMVLYYGKDNDKVVTAPSKDYGIELNGKDAFFMSLDWRVHGYSLRKMSLMNRIGIDDIYLNSCEYQTRKYYLNCKKICFCQGQVFYRQDNPDAITKRFHPLSIDFVATNGRLLSLAIDAKLSLPQIKYFISYAVNVMIYYICQYNLNKGNFKPEQVERADKIIKSSLLQFFKQSIKCKAAFAIIKLVLAKYLSYPKAPLSKLASKQILKYIAKKRI